MATCIAPCITPIQIVNSASWMDARGVEDRRPSARGPARLTAVGQGRDILKLSDGVSIARNCWSGRRPQRHRRNWPAGSALAGLGDGASSQQGPTTTTDKSQKKPRIIISGAPASGKGTQCASIVEKYGLVHISAGDLLRAEVAAQSEAGKIAAKYMNAGQLVPNDVIVTMVRSRLAQPDCQERGWLLDGYPRSKDQADALEASGIRPDLFLVLEVPDEVLVERVAGRRQDPATGRIYHLKFSPPESAEVAARLTQRSDDNETAVRARLAAHKSNVDAVLGCYADILCTVDGNRAVEDVFADVNAALSRCCGGGPDKNSTKAAPKPYVAGSFVSPTHLNNVPHTSYIRNFFYDDVKDSVLTALAAGKIRLKLRCLIPELNPQQDVYRIGTLLELVRHVAFALADDGKRVRVCVQQSMGTGVFQGLPLALNGVRKIMELMDWGAEGGFAEFVRLGAIGADQVAPDDDVFIIVAPQSIVGHSIIPLLQDMLTAVGDRPMILINPNLNDIPSAGGVMQVRGRDKRIEFASTFEDAYHFRLLYRSGAEMYPIYGALRYFFGHPWEVYKRNYLGQGEEEYVFARAYNTEPSRSAITDVFTK
eukprot:jgi/Mesvir1/20786/Mv07896-RA.1